MHEWAFAIQKLIRFINDNAMDNPSLSEISKQLGYSPYYCSVQFHRIAGMTIKSYMALRRLHLATIALRNTNARIIDIALDCGYSSQSVLTRAFKDAYGCTPATYRKNPVAVPPHFSKVVLSLKHFTSEGDFCMSNVVLPSYRFEHIPAHKYLGVYEPSATCYGSIWAKHDCDLVTGIVSGFKHCHNIVTPHTAGWTWKNGNRTYFYGTGVGCGYDGEVPEGFELRGEFPASDYIVFSHPPFHYPTENGEVMKRVEELAWNFDPTTIGYEWNEDGCQDYQRHYPEGLGYQVLRPVRKKQ